MVWPGGNRSLAPAGKMRDNGCKARRAGGPHGVRGGDAAWRLRDSSERRGPRPAGTEGPGASGRARPDPRRRPHARQARGAAVERPRRPPRARQPQARPVAAPRSPGLRRRPARRRPSVGSPRSRGAERGRRGVRTTAGRTDPRRCGGGDRALPRRPARRHRRPRFRLRAMAACRASAPARPCGGGRRWPHGAFARGRKPGPRRRCRTPADAISTRSARTPAAP